MSARIVNTVRQKGTAGLAWASWIIAAVGGTLAVDTFVGHLAVKILQAIPWGWVPAVLLAALVIGMGLDLFLDWIPNQFAVGAAMAIPSVAAAATGRLGAKVTEFSGDLLRWLDGSLTGWLGTSSSTGLAVACIVAATLMARRVVKKATGGAGVVIR